ncbi:MAG: hypothetical protein QM492_10185 [Rhodobacterales bacterium]
MGASTLIEILEASAAYLTLVLGKEHYSEAQISANLPDHFKDIVTKEDRVTTVNRLIKREYLYETGDGLYTISIARKAAYQKKYLAG